MRVATKRTAGPTPSPGVQPAYRAAAPAAPIDLWLAGNEGRAPLDMDVGVQGAALGRYPDSSSLEQTVAERFGVNAPRVLATAGADDGLLRLALGYLGPGREIVLPSPTFVMIERYARLAGGTVVEVPWPPGTPYPTEAVLSAVTDRTALIAVVSPNNPTGAVATPADVRRLGEAAPGALLVVDCAYAEFAHTDLTPAALDLPNGVALRTLSKAYGCAGLRVGFALGPEHVIEVLRAAGNPYPCATPSIAAAAARLQMDFGPFRATVQEERALLVELLGSLGLDAYVSQGNFVYAESGPGMSLSAAQIAELLTGFGIAVRAFPASNGRAAALRITCPGDAGDFQRLRHAVSTVLAPEAILFDMDGVLADVRSSYRAAIIGTAASFGVTLSAQDIEERKALGNANDDWALTHDLVEARGVSATLEEVTARFERLYQGAGREPGLREEETLLLPRASLEALGKRWPLGIVTGRPQADAQAFLRCQGIEDLFPVVVAREEAALKPDPAPTRRALEALGVTRAWLIGDTPDDIQSARGAAVLGVGVLPPGASEGPLHGALTSSGAGTVLSHITELNDLLLGLPTPTLP